MKPRIYLIDPRQRPDSRIAAHPIAPGDRGQLEAMLQTAPRMPLQYRDLEIDTPAGRLTVYSSGRSGEPFSVSGTAPVTGVALLAARDPSAPPVGGFSRAPTGLRPAELTLEQVAAMVNFSPYSAEPGPAEARTYDLAMLESFRDEIFSRLPDDAVVRIELQGRDGTTTGAETFDKSARWPFQRALLDAHDRRETALWDGLARAIPRVGSEAPTAPLGVVLGGAAEEDADLVIGLPGKRRLPLRWHRPLGPAPRAGSKIKTFAVPGIAAWTSTGGELVTWAPRQAESA